MKPELALPLPKTGHYIVAVSGGVDSVALLHMLLHQPEHNLRLRVVHVNHGLRPDATSDERFVRELAAAYDLPFESIQLELGQASEAAARDLRYQYLQNIMTARQARGIITAHHGDDQLETSLFNTLRGSGRHGQAASLKRQQILRPLLGLTKPDLVSYAKSHGLAWREDSTNRDTTISRNFIRHELLSDDPDYARKHRDLIAAHRSINRRLDGRLNKIYYDFKMTDGIHLPRTWVASQSWPALAAFFHYVLRKLEPGREYSSNLIEDLVRLAKTASAGSQISLSQSLKLQVGYDKVAIVVATQLAAPLPSLQLNPGTSLRYGPFWLIYGSQPTDSRHRVSLPQGSYTVRVAQAGDRMMTSVGTKKIQDIFVDKKIARAKRQRWPLIAGERGEILWLPLLMIDPRLQQPAADGYYLIAEEYDEKD